MLNTTISEYTKRNSCRSHMCDVQIYAANKIMLIASHEAKLYHFISLWRIDYRKINTIKSKSGREFKNKWAEKGMNAIQNYHNK
jgi:hypothetical protein